MIEVDVRSIALFFFYALMDEHKAIEAASGAVQLCKEKVSQQSGISSSAALVWSTHSVWQKFRQRYEKGKHHYSPETGWIFPEEIDLGPWKEFQKISPEEEFLAMIWSQILKISDEDVAVGLGISVGTLRYRVGKGLKRLGSLTKPMKVKNPTILEMFRP